MASVINPPFTAWSYSRYALYTECPARFKYTHLDKLPTVAGPAMTRGREVHKAGEEYLKAPKAPKLPPEYKFFSEEMKHLRKLNPLVEQQWGFKRDWSPTGWFGADVWVRGIADVAVVYDDDTGLVIDHKTGKKYQTNEVQMELFGLVTLSKFPQLTEVETRLWYLDIAEDNEVSRTYYRKDVPALRKDWEKRVTPMFADRKFPPRPNDKCRWCDFSKEKGGPCKF